MLAGCRLHLVTLSDDILYHAEFIRFHHHLFQLISKEDQVVANGDDDSGQVIISEHRRLHSFSDYSLGPYPLCLNSLESLERLPTRI